MFYVFFFHVLLYILCWKQSLCWLLFLLAFVLNLSSNNVSVWWKKLFFSSCFSCFFFSHTKHRNPTKRNWNRMQSVGSVFLPYKSVSVLNMLKVKTEILSSVQKLSWTLTEPNWLHPYYQYNHSIPFLMNAITSLQHCSNRILSTNSLMILPSRRDTLFIIFVSFFFLFLFFFFFFLLLFFYFFFFLFYVGTHCLLISTRKKKCIN